MQTMTPDTKFTQGRHISAVTFALPFHSSSDDDRAPNGSHELVSSASRIRPADIGGASSRASAAALEALASFPHGDPATLVNLRRFFTVLPLLQPGVATSSLTILTQPFPVT